MSRTDTDFSAEATAVEVGRSLEITDPREVPLGGLRAMTVRRTLPNRQRTTIGPWCFLDHYGPDTAEASGGMHVPPHPHTGLQTVSWLFEGAITHQDSTGALATVRPGELNLMTAGRGVQHSEVSSPESTVLHGVQLWVVLPEDARHQNPHFEAAPALQKHMGGAKVSLFVGSLPHLGSVATPVYWPMFGAEIVIPAEESVTLDLDSSHEVGVLVDYGNITIARAEVVAHQLAYLPPGETAITITASQDSRLIMIGGQPFEEEIVMWWNFIGRSHEEIVDFRQQWQAGLEAGSDRFGHLDHLPALPAPEMPSVRLRPRSKR
jgi:quercetin 2,3-dioxygenase